MLSLCWLLYYTKVERDQERSKTHMAVVVKENTMTQVNLKELEVESLRNELQV